MEKAQNSYIDLGFAKIDTSRNKRIGQPEVIYCLSKTPEQVVQIMRSMAADGSNVLGTKVTEPMYQYIAGQIAGVQYNPVAQTVTLIQKPVEMTDSFIAIVAAGTSDLPVVEEACETAQFLGNKVVKVMDVGVAGIHRLFDKLELIRAAKVVVVVAGMEGALASVLGGLVSSPVIAVPTSVGYGAGFNGIAALLSMLNSCTTVSVVNIDNGYGAACQASKINHL